MVSESKLLSHKIQKTQVGIKCDFRSCISLSNIFNKRIMLANIVQQIHIIFKQRTANVLHYPLDVSKYINLKRMSVNASYY